MLNHKSENTNILINFWYCESIAVLPRSILSAERPPFKNLEKLFSNAALKEIGDQIEYLPPTVSGNKTMQFLLKPRVFALSVFAVIAIELVEFLFAPSHLKHNRVSSVEKDLEENIDYLKPRIKKEKVIAFIAGGPNKYYDFNDKIIDKIFVKTKKNFINQGYQLIFIPSMRTPQRIIDKAQNFFDDNQIIIQDIDKKAYLSSLKLANHIIVTCDSTSMISEAAMSGRPIYVAQMPAIKKNIRFKKFFELFKSLDIIKNLEDTVEEWSYKKLNETHRISGYIEKQFKNYDFS